MGGSKLQAVALDGHDGTGKTTAALRLATKLKAQYVRPYAAPYGPQLLEAATRGDHHTVVATATAAIEHALATVDRSRAIVFDRLWITVLTLLPAEYHARIDMSVPTGGLWADLPTTLTRLATRREDPASKTEHEFYISAYRQLAATHRCLLLDTGACSEPEIDLQLERWASPLLTRSKP